MLIKQLKRWLTTPIDSSFNPQLKFWFYLSMILATIYVIQGLKEGFSSYYAIQDDARQHVFWAQRFLDPELFPNDLIADYFQASAPLGYTTFYRIFAIVGIDPILVSKLLPIILGLIVTGYGFGLLMEILPVPAAGFIYTWLLNQGLWSGPSIVTATPRAFAPVFFLVFLYYLLRRSLFPCLITIALLGLFYPPGVLMTAGLLILRLFRWQRGLPRLSLDRNNVLLCFTGLGIIFLVLLPEVLTSSEFGPTITLAEAKTLPEFYSGGRTNFFSDNLWDTLFNSHRTALMVWPFKSPSFYVALSLPILLLIPSRFPLARQITPGVTVLIQMVLVSLGLYAIAFAVLFKLYLPSRYALAQSMAITLATAIALVVILDAILCACEEPRKIKLTDLALFFGVYALVVILYWFNYYYPKAKLGLVALLALGFGITLILFMLDYVFDLGKQGRKHYLGQQFLALTSTIVLAGGFLIYPSFWEGLPKNDYSIGEVPQLYQFLSQQPKDILIASLAKQADYLPSFAKRSVLVSREYALPYEVGYYKQIRQRAIDTIDAQYSPNLEPLKGFIKKYGIDFWLLDRAAFTPEYLTNGSWQSSWIRQYQPAATEATDRLKQGTVPALARVMKRCAVVETEKFILVGGECIVKVGSE